MNQPNDLPQTEQTLHRRDLLKVLAASGGALTAAALLPARWLKPAVDAGVLPAHAQSTLVCAALQFLDEYACDQGGGAIPCSNYAWVAAFSYQPAGLTPQRLARFTACGQNIPGDVYYDPQNYPGRLFLRYNIPSGIPAGGCGDTTFTLQFAEGCVGVYAMLPATFARRSGLFR